MYLPNWRAVPHRPTRPVLAPPQYQRKSLELGQETPHKLNDGVYYPARSEQHCVVVRGRRCRRLAPNTNIMVGSLIIRKLIESINLIKVLLIRVEWDNNGEFSFFHRVCKEMWLIEILYTYDWLIMKERRFVALWVLPHLNAHWCNNPLITYELWDWELGILWLTTTMNYVSWEETCVEDKLRVH